MSKAKIKKRKKKAKESLADHVSEDLAASCFELAASNLRIYAEAYLEDRRVSDCFLCLVPRVMLLNEGQTPATVVSPTLPYDLQFPTPPGAPDGRVWTDDMSRARAATISLNAATEKEGCVGVIYCTIVPSVRIESQTGITEAGIVVPGHTPLRTCDIAVSVYAGAAGVAVFVIEVHREPRPLLTTPLPALLYRSGRTPGHPELPNIPVWPPTLAKLGTYVPRDGDEHSATLETCEEAAPKLWAAVLPALPDYSPFVLAALQDEDEDE